MSNEITPWRSKALYIAGPMTGIVEHNFPAFNVAEWELASAGYKVLNPASRGSGTKSWADYLRRDLEDVLASDGVAVLPGWESSKGARLEVHVCHTLGTPVATVGSWVAGNAEALAAPAVMPTQMEVLAWLQHNFGPERSVNEQALVVAEEVGELCRALVKRSQNIRGPSEEWSAEVRKEAGDVAIALHAVAATEGFDLIAAIADRWSDVSKRDFHADPTGHGMPATE